MAEPSTETPARRGLTASPRYPLIVIALAVLSHGGFALSGQGFTPFYPFIRDDFNLSATQIGLVTGTIFAAATGPPPCCPWQRAAIWR